MLLYTIGLVAASVLPYFTHMSGLPYLASALCLGVGFVAYAVALRQRGTDKLARATFRYSINYLALLFSALLMDHFLWGSR